MEQSIMLFDGEQLIDQFFFPQLQVTLPNTSLITIGFDDRSRFLSLTCRLRTLRFASRAKSLVVGIGFFIFQDDRVCDPPACRIKLLSSRHNGGERDPRGAILLSL